MPNVTSLNDIAGQLTAASHNADKVTVGGVCLPSGALSYIRDRIPDDFPKWRDATDEHVAFMISLACRESLGIAVSSLDKRTESWTKFWKDATEAHAKVTNLSGGSIGFIKAASMLKFLLFSMSATIAVAQAVQSGVLPKVIDRRGRLPISQTVVFDTDIQGKDNIDAFAEIWRSLNSSQPRVNSLGIDWNVATMRVTTEQKEPLLLMADYIAGVVHAVNSDSNTLERSEVTPQVVKQAHSRLLSSGRFLEFDSTPLPAYFDIFPAFQKYVAEGNS